MATLKRAQDIERQGVRASAGLMATAMQNEERYILKFQELESQWIGDQIAHRKELDDVCAYFAPELPLTDQTFLSLMQS